MFLLTFLLTLKYVKLHFMRIQVFEISQSFKKIVEFLTNVNFPHFVICCFCFVRRKNWECSFLLTWICYIFQ